MYKSDFNLFVWITLILDWKVYSNLHFSESTNNKHKYCICRTIVKI